jgi:hypothetical protein
MRSICFGYHSLMAATPLSPIEQRFRDAQERLPPHARVARAAAMFAWARGLIGRHIQSERGVMPAERLKWEVAMRLYGGEPAARAIIQRMLDRVPA